MTCTFIIFGATGDLSKKKLISSIYQLYKKQKIDDFAIIGVARSEDRKKDILTEAKKHIENIDLKIWKKLEEKFYYFSAEFHNQEKFAELHSFVEDIEKKQNLSGNRIIYLATLPEYFEVLSDNIAKSNLAIEKDNWARVVFEKPFGSDLKSAKKINKCLSTVFKEDQIFRIDHYLEKELVDNVGILRFTNTILEPIWSKKNIDHVQIIMTENFGVEGRGNFYDKYGALKDVVQNHILQMLALSAMEEPKKLSSKFIRDEKQKVLSKTKIEKIVLGQFEGYLDEKGVKPDSTTETLVAAKLSVNTKRWKGVPFYVLAGKNLPKRRAAIYIQFKEPPCHLYEDICEYNPNHLAIQIQPNDGFHIHINSKTPGKREITQVKMDFCHSCTFGPNTPDAYENLFADVIKGDQSVFVRNDEIEEQWKIIDSISKKKLNLIKYIPGKFPEEFKLFIQKDKRNWHMEV